MSYEPLRGGNLPFEFSVSYVEPSGSAVAIEFVNLTRWLQPFAISGAVGAATVANSAQGIFPAGISPSGDVGRAWASNSTRYLSPAGFSEFDFFQEMLVARGLSYIYPSSVLFNGFVSDPRDVSISFYRPRPGGAVNIDFAGDAYTAPSGAAVPVEFTAQYGGYGSLYLAGWDSALWGTADVRGATATIEPSGFDEMGVGDHDVEFSGVGADRNLYPYGIAAPTDQIPNTHAIRWSRQIAAPNGLAPGAFGTTVLTNQHRYLDLSGRGIVGAVGTHFVADAVRYLYPLYIAPGQAGTPYMVYSRYLEPSGWLDEAHGTQYVHDLTQWVNQNGAAGVAEYGTPSVDRNPRILEPVGFPSTVETINSTRWGRPTVYNLRQYVGQMNAPGPEDGGVFGSPIWMTVENRNRTMGEIGWASSKVSNLAFVENKAVPILPPTLGAETCGAGTFIAHAIRYISTEGWEEFYSHPLLTEVVNAARTLAPAGMEPGGFGLAAYSNPPQDLRFVGGINQEGHGTAFVADAVRRLTIIQGVDGFPIPEPWISNAIRYIEPVGFEKQLPFGAPFVEERFTIFYPSGFNALRLGFEHEVRNHDREVYVYPYDFTEWGVPYIGLYTRYLLPEHFGDTLWGSTIIKDSKQFVQANGVIGTRMGQGHQVTKIPPDPPASQTIYQAGFTWTVYGNGTEVRRNEINPEGAVQTKWGDAEVRLIGAIVPSILALDPMFGTHSVRGPQRVFVNTEFDEGLGPQEFPKHDMKPRTIWATFDVTQQAIENHGGQWKLMDHMLDTMDTGMRPLFGQQTITLSRRSIRAGDNEFGGMGEHSVESTIRHLRPDGLKATRFGVAKLPFAQEIEFRLGGPDMGALGSGHVVELKNRRLTVQSLPMPGEGTEDGQWGVTEIDFFHRYRSPAGWDSVLWGQPSPQNNRNSQGLRVHYPDPFIPTGTVMTKWGDTFISHWIRNVYTSGFTSFEMGSTPGYFRERMRVMHGKRSLTPASIAPGASGTPTLGEGTRTLYQDRMRNGFAAGTPDIRYRAIIALGGYSFDASVFGDVQRWEAGKIKPQGEEHTSFGNVRTNRSVPANGWSSEAHGTHAVGPSANVQGWEGTEFGSAVMVYGDGLEFTCGRKPHALVLGDFGGETFGAASVA